MRAAGGAVRPAASIASLGPKIRAEAEEAPQRGAERQCAQKSHDAVRVRPTCQLHAAHEAGVALFREAAVFCREHIVVREVIEIERKIVDVPCEGIVFIADCLVSAQPIDGARPHVEVVEQRTYLDEVRHGGRLA